MVTNSLSGTNHQQQLCFSDFIYCRHQQKWETILLNMRFLMSFTFQLKYGIFIISDKGYQTQQLHHEYISAPYEIFS